jgi:hypothetical protein
MLIKKNSFKLIKPFRNLIIAATLSLPLALVTQPASAATWLLVVDSESGGSSYIDTDSIRRDESTVWYWAKNIMSNGSFITYQSGDCNARLIRMREFHRYTSNGTLIGSSTPGDYGPLSRVIPDSVGEALLEQACRWTQAQMPRPVVPTATINSNRFVWKFPLATCGDRSSNGTWWPVFINNGNLSTVRNKYCRDAISVTRESTGMPAVMLASFSSYEKAAAFARAVGGEVGQPTVD